MSDNKTGGSAFPHQEMHDSMEPFQHLPCSEGLSTRDYFAIHADVPWRDVAEDFTRKQSRACERPATIQELAEYTAQIRYAMADAMLAERAK